MSGLWYDHIVGLDGPRSNRSCNGEQRRWGDVVCCDSGIDPMDLLDHLPGEPSGLGGVVVVRSDWSLHCVACGDAGMGVGMGPAGNVDLIAFLGGETFCAWWGVKTEESKDFLLI